MKKLISYSLLIVAIPLVLSFRGFSPVPAAGLPTTNDTIQYPEEKHFKNVRQLTFGGDNAEAYWSYDSKYIIFQRTNPKEGIKCDQIYIGKAPLKPGDKFEYR